MFAVSVSDSYKNVKIIGLCGAYVRIKDFINVNNFDIVINIK